MGNDPLTGERYRDADWENRTWTRGRTSLKHTTGRKNGQPDLFGSVWPSGHVQPGAALATDCSDQASLFTSEILGQAPLSRKPWRA
jgi:hypothetical protein